MTNRTVRSLLWWLPALILAAVAGIMPDTFLDSPMTTIPHDAAYLLRCWMIFIAFLYMVVIATFRALTYLAK